jgi:hypothetical protein
LPAFFFAQLAFEGGHRAMPLGDFPKKFAVGYAGHSVRVGEIRWRNGKFFGALPFSVAVFPVTVLAVIRVGAHAHADGLRRGRKGIALLAGFFWRGPVAEGIDNDASRSGDDHEYHQDAEQVRFEFGVRLLISGFVGRHDLRACLRNFSEPGKFSHCAAGFSTVGAPLAADLTRGVNRLIDGDEHDHQHGYDINA